MSISKKTLRIIKQTEFVTITEGKKVNQSEINVGCTVKFLMYAANPDKIRGFLLAVSKGWMDAIESPEDAVKSMIARNPAADLALETRRLKLAIDGNVHTDYVKKNGMGKIDNSRMDKALLQLAQTYEFSTNPDISSFYTDEYLP